MVEARLCSCNWLSNDEEIRSSSARFYALQNCIALSKEGRSHAASTTDCHDQSGDLGHARAEGICPATDVHPREFRGKGGIGWVLHEALQRVSQRISRA